MKIYTKTGDKGQTSLYGGKRVSKDDVHVAAYGGVDEINSSVGVVKAHTPDTRNREKLDAIQRDLLSIGAYLAGSPAKLDVLEKRTAALERDIDTMEAQLPPLHNFILPGGSREAALAHQTRSTVRSAERRVVALNHIQPVDKRVLEYLNRLSDYFFVLARYYNKQANIPEQIWNERK